jgi:hypothetical protein
LQEILPDFRPKIDVSSIPMGWARRFHDVVKTSPIDYAFFDAIMGPKGGLSHHVSQAL